jgi:dTDP-glucose 4,6-dehydratase
VDGLYRLLHSDEEYPVNLGNPTEMTIRQFAEAIRDRIGSKSAIIYEPLPEDDPKQRKPDITKARTLLGWEPKVTLEDGIEKTIEYFRGAVPIAFSH